MMKNIKLNGMVDLSTEELNTINGGARGVFSVTIKPVSSSPFSNISIASGAQGNVSQSQACSSIFYGNSFFYSYNYSYTCF